MRKQGNGTIVNISCVDGTVGLLPFVTAYHASKFAIEGFTESLRQELGRLMDEAYDKRVLKFLEEYEWYIEAFKNQRNKGTPY